MARGAFLMRISSAKCKVALRTKKKKQEQETQRDRASILTAPQGLGRDAWEGSSDPSHSPNERKKAGLEHCGFIRV